MEFVESSLKDMDKSALRRSTKLSSITTCGINALEQLCDKSIMTDTGKIENTHNKIIIAQTVYTKW